MKYQNLLFTIFVALDKLWKQFDRLLKHSKSLSWVKLRTAITRLISESLKRNVKHSTTKKMQPHEKITIVSSPEINLTENKIKETEKTHKKIMGKASSSSKKIRVGNCKIKSKGRKSKAKKKVTKSQVGKNLNSKHKNLVFSNKIKEKAQITERSTSKLLVKLDKKVSEKSSSSYVPDIEGINDTKKDMTTKDLKNLTLKHIEKHYPTTQWLCIYTDGSANNGKAGAGVYCDLFEASYTLEGSCMDAEIFAIQKAVENIKKLESKYIVILSDCKSALQTVAEKYDKEKPFEKNKTIFQWIPGHCGIHGNFMADKLAKDGCKGLQNFEDKRTTK
jgi:ribonuclease HI